MGSSGRGATIFSVFATVTGTGQTSSSRHHCICEMSVPSSSLSGPSATLPSKVIAVEMEDKEDVRQAGRTVSSLSHEATVTSERGRIGIKCRGQPEASTQTLLSIVRTGRYGNTVSPEVEFNYLARKGSRSSQANALVSFARGYVSDIVAPLTPTSTACAGGFPVYGFISRPRLTMKLWNNKHCATMSGVKIIHDIAAYSGRILR